MKNNKRYVLMRCKVLFVAIAYTFIALTSFFYIPKTVSYRIPRNHIVLNRYEKILNVSFVKKTDKATCKENIKLPGSDFPVFYFGALFKAPGLAHSLINFHPVDYNTLASSRHKYLLFGVFRA